MAASKETTPASDAKASDASKTITFTEKEERVLKVAWSCLKSGPPDVDIEKLTKAGGFNTQKTAANTWGVIKKKLLAMAPAAAEGAEGVEATPKTPTTAKATPKKRGAKKADADDDEGAENGSPKKKRKTPVKKGKKAEAEADADAEEAEAVKEEAE